MKQHKLVKNLVLTALFIALGLVFPSLFHVFGAGTVFLPMHIPVLLCGFVCGPLFGAVCGLIVPLLSSLTSGMPPIFPTAVAMMAELCAYGALTGFFYKRWNVYISLIGAMLGGRIVSGVANAILYSIAGKPYGFSIFLTGAFVTALPGIIIQIVAVPAVILILQKARLIAGPARLSAADHS